MPLRLVFLWESFCFFFFKQVFNELFNIDFSMKLHS